MIVFNNKNKFIACEEYFEIECLKESFVELVNELDREQYNKHKYITKFTESFLVAQGK